MTYHVELPLPPKGCSPNARFNSHWATHSGVKRDYRNLCRLEYIKARNEGRLPKQFKLPVTVHLEFYLANPNIPGTCHTKAQVNGWGIPRDADNARASFKQGQDALTDASLVPGDGQKQVLMGKTTLLTKKGEHQGKSCILVTFEEPELVVETRTT